MLEQALTQLSTSSLLRVVITSEVVRSRMTLTEYHLSPEHDFFVDQCFDLLENDEVLQLPIEVRVFEQIAVSKVQTVRTHVQTDVVRREIADISGLHGKVSSTVDSGPDRSEAPIT